MTDHRCVEEYKDKLRERLDALVEEICKYPGHCSNDKLAREELDALAYGAADALKMVSYILLEGVLEEDLTPKELDRVVRLQDMDPTDLAREVVELSATHYYREMVA